MNYRSISFNLSRHVDQLTQQMVELMGAEEVGEPIGDDIVMEVLEDTPAAGGAGGKNQKKKKK